MTVPVERESEHESLECMPAALSGQEDAIEREEVRARPRQDACTHFRVGAFTGQACLHLSAPPNLSCATASFAPEACSSTSLRRESVATRLAAAVPEKRVLELIVDHQDHGAASSAGEVRSV